LAKAHGQGVFVTDEIQVLGVGNAIVDVISRADETFLDERDIPKGAMSLISQDQAHELYEAMGPGIEVSGGSAANTMAGIASFGGKAGFIGRVRDDQLGAVFAHDIRAAGVGYDTAASTQGPATARCLILVTPDGERTMNTFLGASTELGPDDIADDMVARAQITYLEGYLWDPPKAKQAFVKAAGLAHAAGRKVSLTLSDPFCVDRYRDEFKHLIDTEIDILFANEAEILSLFETGDFDTALQAVRSKGLLAALTRSAAGCVIVHGDEVHVVPAAPVEKVVDTTGAGDLFAAGFLFGHATGRDLAACGRLGAIAAAEIISHIGARPETGLAGLADEI
jgi:sugar/nucleoside kinase (ribokinase family)